MKLTGNIQVNKEIHAHSLYCEGYEQKAVIKNTKGISFHGVFRDVFEETVCKLTPEG